MRKAFLTAVPGFLPYRALGRRRLRHLGPDAQISPFIRLF
jgi:hypothetical protein